VNSLAFRTISLNTPVWTEIVTDDEVIAKIRLSNGGIWQLSGVGLVELRVFQANMCSISNFRNIFFKVDIQFVCVESLLNDTTANVLNENVFEIPENQKYLRVPIVIPQTLATSFGNDSCK
jgi:hypothetical protein